MKKAIYDRPRPARLGKPKPFNTKTKAYKTAVLVEVVSFSLIFYP